jgi:hypothetical protein
VSDSKYRPYADLKVKVREYDDKETGKKKGVWMSVGTIFATPHLSSQFMVMDALPINSLDREGNKIPFDGKVSIFKRDDFASQEEVTSADDLVSKPKDVVIEDIDDKPIDLSEIPF